jgi:hypothetical protein
MKATVIRSPGAVWPLLPRADAGMIVGIAINAAVCFMNCRLLTGTDCALSELRIFINGPLAVLAADLAAVSHVDAAFPLSL